MDDKPDIVIFPPTASVLAPAIAATLQWLVPISILPGWFSLWSFLLGLVLLLAAASLAITGERAFRAAGTNVNPREPALTIVRSGPYRFTRNPMYLGMVLLQLGIAFTFSLDWALITGFLLWAILHFGVVLREEAYLSQKFGEAYKNLVTQTRRWL